MSQIPTFALHIIRHTADIWGPTNGAHSGGRTNERTQQDPNAGAPALLKAAVEIPDGATASPKIQHEAAPEDAIASQAKMAFLALAQKR